MDRKMNEIVRGHILPADRAQSPYGEDGEGRHSTSLPEIDRILSAILNHRNWVMSAIVGALLLGFLATFLATPEYTSTARIEVLPDSPEIGRAHV